MIHDCASELQGGVSLMSEDTSLYSNDSFSSVELENYRYVNNIDGISPNDKYDPTYACHIDDYYRRNEMRHVAQESSIHIFGPGKVQTELSNNMRMVLVDWLIDVVEQEQLQTSTLHMCVHLIDQSLLKQSFTSRNFQLLGCACLLIASKLDEVIPPQVERLVYLSDFCFDDDALCAMELNIIKLLNFDLFCPTRAHYVERFSLAAELSDKEKQLMLYILDISILDIQLNRCPASKVAAAALHYVLQASRPRNSTLWTPTIAHYTGFQEKELHELVHYLQSLHWNIEDTSLTHVVTKYERTTHLKAARVMAIRKSDLRFDFLNNSLTNLQSIKVSTSDMFSP